MSPNPDRPPRSPSAAPPSDQTARRKSPAHPARGLTEQRIQTIEATALLRRVVDEIDAPLFTFDPDHILRLVNAAGERLLQQPSARLLGKTADELELNACFEARNETLVALPYSTPNARWMVRQSSFRRTGSRTNSSCFPT